MAESEAGLVKFSDSNISFQDSSVPGFIIEGLIGTAITQVYQQFSYFNELYTNPKHEKHGDWLVNGQALCIVAYEEAKQTMDCLDNMKDATLAPKHKAYKKITKNFLKNLEGLEKKTRKAKRKDNQSFINSIANIADWLQSTTIVMSSYSDIKDIKAEASSWDKN